ncbi:MAG TPA: alpha/beta hydrolase [Solirubrobacteraceae bacterium]|nr:alpha/beta hydrolase [Solirubrobacteraceae bacterium]
MEHLSGMPELEGVEHHVIEVRGARLHVAELGSGPPVLLVHGWPQHWGSWRRLMPLLAEDHRVLALDLRGFGWSEATPRGYRKDELAEDVVGVLDALGIERVRLVGHDWGGIVGFLVCLNHPDRVARFVPMNTGHPWPTLPLRRLPKQVGGFAYQAVLAAPVIGRHVGGSPRVLRAVLRLISTNTDAVMDEFDSYAERFADPARARAAQQVYLTFQLYELPAWLRGRYRDQRLGTPTLWLHGVKDPVITPALFKDIGEHADDVRIEYLEDCGHFPPEEQPGLVAEHLRAFFSA